MTPEIKGKILVLDNEPQVLNELTGILEADHYQVSPCLTGKEALALFKEKDFDLLITEWRLEAQNGSRTAFRSWNRSASWIQPWPWWS